MSRLVILHQGAIGDFLLTLSVVQAARESLGVDSATAIATAPSARLAAGRSAVDAWLSPEDLGLYRLFCSDLPLGERLAGTLADADFVLNFLGGPAERIHERIERVTTGALVSVDPRPAPRTRKQGMHITSQWAADIRSAGWPIPEPGPARIDMGLAGRPTPPRPTRVLIHPGSGGKTKCWPIADFVALAQCLTGLEVTWMLGPAELEQARRLQDRDEPLLVEEDLQRAAEQMAGFDGYLGNDSGMTHLAAAIGLPTIALFVATDPRIWRPLGRHVTVVAPESLDVGAEALSLDRVSQAVMQHAQFGRPRPAW